MKRCWLIISQFELPWNNIWSWVCRFHNSVTQSNHFYGTKIISVTRWCWRSSTHLNMNLIYSLRHILCRLMGHKLWPLPEINKKVRISGGILWRNSSRQKVVKVYPRLIILEVQDLNHGRITKSYFTKRYFSMNLRWFDLHRFNVPIITNFMIQVFIFRDSWPLAFQ